MKRSSSETVRERSEGEHGKKLLWNELLIYDSFPPIRIDKERWIWKKKKLIVFCRQLGEFGSNWFFALNRSGYLFEWSVNRWFGSRLEDQPLRKDVDGLISSFQSIAFYGPINRYSSHRCRSHRALKSLWRNLKSNSDLIRMRLFACPSQTYSMRRLFTEITEKQSKQYPVVWKINGFCRRKEWKMNKIQIVLFFGKSNRFWQTLGHNLIKR